MMIQRMDKYATERTFGEFQHHLDHVHANAGGSCSIISGYRPMILTWSSVYEHKMKKSRLIWKGRAVCLHLWCDLLFLAMLYCPSVVEWIADFDPSVVIH